MIEIIVSVIVTGAVWHSGIEIGNPEVVVGRLVAIVFVLGNVVAAIVEMEVICRTIVLNVVKDKRETSSVLVDDVLLVRVFDADMLVEDVLETEMELCSKMSFCAPERNPHFSL